MQRPPVRDLWGTIYSYSRQKKQGLIRMNDGNTYRFSPLSYKGLLVSDPTQISIGKTVFFDRSYNVGGIPVRNMVVMIGDKLVQDTKRIATIESIKDGVAMFSSLRVAFNVPLERIRHQPGEVVKVGMQVSFYMTRTGNKCFAERIRLKT